MILKIERKKLYDFFLFYYFIKLGTLEFLEFLLT